MKYSKRRSRRGGAVATFIGIFILLMVGLAIAHAVPGILSGLARDFIGQDRGDCGTGGGTSVDAASKSAVLSELHNSSFWAMVRTSAENTTQNLLRDTVIGYMDKDQEWRNWSLQYMPGATRWADTGFGPYINAQVGLLQARALASGNVTEVFGVLEDQVSRASSVFLAGVDFLFFNSATGLRTYFQTGNATQALCTTYASQLQQLWDQAFNPNLTEQERAQYLGQALAISTVVVAIAGTGGVSSQFKAALDKVGLADSWDTVKPYLGKIGSTVSAKAAYLTFILLGKLAQRFPGNPTWEAGFVSARVEAMVEVLHEKGFSVELVEQKISGLVEAAGDSSSDDVAQRADGISYTDGERLKVKLGTQNRMYLYENQDTMQFIEASFLQKIVPGFRVGDEAFLKVDYLQEGITAYHHYEGGDIWMATVPDDVGKPGDELTIRIQILTRDDFVKDLPSLNFANYAGYKWFPDSVKLNRFFLSGDVLTISAIEDEGVAESTFTIQGLAHSGLNFAPGQGTYLEMDLADVFDNLDGLRIYYDGHGTPNLRIQEGQKFIPVSFIMTDGVRMSFVYGTTQLHIDTIYLREPDVLYNIGDLTEKSLDFQLPGTYRTYLIDSVNYARELERNYQGSGSNYLVGRLGAEIAYAVGKDKLGLHDLVLRNPAQGGPDLFTQDGTAVIEARMLTAIAGAPSNVITADLQDQLTQMVDRITSFDFKNNSAAKVGYAILTYMDNQGALHTIVVEVLKS